MTDQISNDVDDTAELKKKLLVEQVADATDMKKGDVKPVVEAMLKVMGDALAAGQVLNLQPFGKMQLLNEKDTPSARILKCKVRQAKEPGEAHNPEASTQAESSPVPAEPAPVAATSKPAAETAPARPARRKLSLSPASS